MLAVKDDLKRGEYTNAMHNGKHQIMYVHTKWNCLIPILSSLVMYYLFQP